jgi:hypothetical protein
VAGHSAETFSRIAQEKSAVADVIQHLAFKARTVLLRRKEDNLQARDFLDCIGDERPLRFAVEGHDDLIELRRSIRHEGSPGDHGRIRDLRIPGLLDVLDLSFRSRRDREVDPGRDRFITTSAN